MNVFPSPQKERKNKQTGIHNREIVDTYSSLFFKRQDIDLNKIVQTKYIIQYIHWLCRCDVMRYDSNVQTLFQKPKLRSNIHKYTQKKRQQRSNKEMPSDFYSIWIWVDRERKAMLKKLTQPTQTSHPNTSIWVPAMHTVYIFIHLFKRKFS